ncbi:MAG: SRPBCC family protein [Ginsengibacter sp.]
MMNENPIIVEAVYNAPVSKVWQAITDKNQMQKWYFDVSDFETEQGFEFQFNGGTEDKTYVHRCRIVEIIPEKKLCYTWRYDGYPGDSLLTFELFNEDGKTRLKIMHEGLETFSEPDFAKENFRAGWNQIIGSNLKKFVENKMHNIL